MLLLWRNIHQIVAAGDPCMLVGISRIWGSSPREPGAKMIVKPDGGIIETIGGGALEMAAIEYACKRLQDSQFSETSRRFPLGPELGQCCGGHVEISFEKMDGAALAQIAILARQEKRGRFFTAKKDGEFRRLLHEEEKQDFSLLFDSCQNTPPPIIYKDDQIIECHGGYQWPIYLFGAGHVGRALIFALSSLDFKVSWFDPRPDIFPKLVPENCQCITLRTPGEAFKGVTPQSAIFIMTHSHALDLELVDHALRLDFDIMIGLIGSKTKYEKFKRRLFELGRSKDQIKRIQCPIGLAGIRSKAPAAIAASVVADLLIQTERQERQAFG